MFSFVQIFVGIVTHGAARARKLAWPEWFANVSLRTIRVVLLPWVKCGIVIPSLLQDFVTLTSQGTAEVDSMRFSRETAVR
jgi:hypothetical protein